MPGKKVRCVELTADRAHCRLARASGQAGIAGQNLNQPESPERSQRGQ
jgi:hypothetical protein